MCRRRLFTPVLFSLIIGLVAAACAPLQAESPPVPAASQSPTATPQASPVDEGKAAYSAYCAACHGPDAQGSTIAGSLPGHSADIIRRQVRMPMGQMPAFSESQLKDAQLETIVAYIESLPAPENHIEPLEMGDALAVHHWMAVFALKADDAKDASHHLDHIMEMATDSAHKEQAKEAKALVAAGKLHDAEHEVEEMLAGKAEPSMEMTQFHAQLAFSSLSVQDGNDAKHHMEHFMTLASGMERVRGDEVIKLMDMNDMHEAGHALEQMLGMTPHGE